MSGLTLAESKNGAVIRKHLGYEHIPQRFAPKLNEFHRTHFNPYINYHRPCFFPVIETDAKGKQRRRYPYEAMMTPYEKLKSLPNATSYLKSHLTFETLDAQAHQISDNDAAEQLQHAKRELFNHSPIEADEQTVRGLRNLQRLAALDKKMHRRTFRTRAAGFSHLDLLTTAVGHGRRAAEAIERKFLGVVLESNGKPVILADRLRLDHYPKMERGQAETLDIDDRLTDMDVEVNLGFAMEQLVLETQRCMSCGYCMDCEKCWLFCQDKAVIKPQTKGELYSFNLQNCTGCKKCAEECPCGFIDMV